jgi:uncharacterized protein
MKKQIFLIFSVLLVLSSFGQNIPPRPEPPRLVNDFSDILSRQEESDLEMTLEDFARTTSTQIVVVTLKSLDGYPVEDIAFKLGEQWGVGQKDKDNGVVIILKPKTIEEKGEVFIATGYGIEHLIPDAVANNQIVDAEMIPKFKQNDYYGGLVAGTKVIMALTKGEYTADAYKEKVSKKSEGSPLFFLLFLLFFIIIPIARGRRKGYYSAGRSLPFWIALGMMGSGRNSHHGSFGNFTSGGGGFGGFGGFGGGSFGGGGAGGSW